jgi:hypothetical protein
MREAFQKHAGWVILIWLISALFFMINAERGGLLSWQGIVALAAAIPGGLLLGGLGAALSYGLGGAFPGPAAPGEDGKPGASSTSGLTLLLGLSAALIEALAAIVLARAVVHLLLG